MVGNEEAPPNASNILPNVMKTGKKVSGFLWLTSSSTGSCIMNDTNNRMKATAEAPLATKPTNLKQTNVYFFYMMLMLISSTVYHLKAIILLL